MSTPGAASQADQGEDLFASQRPRLLGLAYRLLGSSADAEDVVQEAWVRWSTADRPTIANVPGWLTTVTTRLALDRLRSVRRRREVYVGQWLPDPISTEPSPSEHAERAESLTVGFLVVLDRLAPVERAVFLLADVFDEPFSVIASAVNKSPGACRQIATRARRKIRQSDGSGPPAPAPAELLVQLVGAFVAGDEEQALRLLAPDVVLVADAGPNRRAARRPVVGPYRVQRLASGGWRLLGFRTKPAPEDLPTGRLRTVNASPALVVESPGGPIVLSAARRHGLVTHLWMQCNPDKAKGLLHPPALW